MVALWSSDYVHVHVFEEYEWLEVAGRLPCVTDVRDSEFVRGDSTPGRKVQDLWKRDGAINDHRSSIVTDFSCGRNRGDPREPRLQAAESIKTFDCRVRVWGCGWRRPTTAFGA